LLTDEQKAIALTQFHSCMCEEKGSTFILFMIPCMVYWADQITKKTDSNV